MSDIGITFPPWFVIVALSVQFWPFVAILAAVAVAGAILWRGLARLAAAALSTILLADLAVVGVLEFNESRAAAAAADFERNRQSTLAAAQTIDGVTLPAGTLVSWTDSSHAHIESATPPGPADVLGVTVIWLQRDQPDSWRIRLDADRSIDGWTCQPDLVGIAADGHLRSCTLAAARQWNGWPIPAATLLSLERPDRIVGLVLPEHDPVMAPEIDRPLPNTGQMTINPDGSLDSVYLQQDAPLTVCGTPLWNTLRWEYAADTFGRGRARPAVILHGALVEALARGSTAMTAGTEVAVRLADCTLTAG